MRADVADRPQRAALVGLEPPVPVGVEQQPVLEVVAGHEPDVAQAAVGDELADVLVERVEADVEVDRVDEAAPRGVLDEPGRLSAAVIASGFSQTTCLPAARIARACGTWRWFGEVTWTTSIVGVVEDGVEAGVGMADAERRCPRCAALRRAAEHAADLDADAPELLDVDGADEPGPDDGGADVGDSAHGHSQRRTATRRVLTAARSAARRDCRRLGAPTPPNPGRRSRNIVL